MFRRLQVISGVLFALCASAATVTSNVACVNGSSVVFGFDQCRNSANGGYSEAETSVKFGFANGTFSEELNAMIDAGGTEEGHIGAATAEISTEVQFNTVGPSRPGLLFGYIVQDFLRNGAGGGSGFSVSPNIFTSFPFYPSSLYPQVVALGTPITVYANAYVNGYAGFADEAAGGGPGLLIDFFFTEADGKTPVALSEAPEPTSGFLASIAIITGAGLIATKKRKGAYRTDPVSAQVSASLI